MAKYLIQDIIPPNKKRQAGEKRLESHVRGKEEAAHHTTAKSAVAPAASKEETFTPKEAGTYVGSPREEFVFEKKKRRFMTAVPIFAAFSRNSGIWSGGGSFLAQWVPWLLGAGILFVLTVFGFDYFSGATVTILPKRDAIPVAERLFALKDPQNGELPYAVMKITLSESREVPATGQKTVTEKARGKVVIYNTQTVAQRLIKNTRFESSSGKIYRINGSVTVPKATTEGGKTLPGTLTVTVYADEPGPEFNGDPDDFTLPGLKGGVLFEKVYGRGSGPLTGGASGVIKTVSESDMKLASDELRIALETKLRAKARGDMAPSQIGYDSGIVVELKDPALAATPASEEDKAVITQEGTLSMVLFDRKELVKALAKAVIPTYQGEEIRVKNLDALTFEPAGMLRAEELWTNEKIEFSLKGTPELEWIIDEAALKKELLNIPKENFNLTLAKYSTIERAKATLSPFWKQSFPENPEDITINVVEVMEE